MSRTNLRRIKKQSNTINGVSYDIIQQPTNAAFIPKETMETNEEKKDLRQAGPSVYDESKLAENTNTERQKTSQGTYEIMEDEAVGNCA